jgi:hypothetical protein
LEDAQDICLHWWFGGEFPNSGDDPSGLNVHTEISSNCIKKSCSRKLRITSARRGLLRSMTTAQVQDASCTLGAEPLFCPRSVHYATLWTSDECVRNVHMTTNILVFV